MSFDTLGLAPQMLEILRANKFVTATPIQEKSIPVALQGSDVIGIAQTGTGKTLAFGLPMIERLARHKGRGLIILPTRELALQVEEALKAIGGKLGMKTAVLIGGASMSMQVRALKMNPHLVIATPGRLIDHLEHKTIKLNDVKILVLDEADRMLDMGFAPQINRILTSVPKERQTLLFSATMPADIVRIATEHMKMPVRVEVAPAGTASERVSQELIIVEKSMKISLLGAILKEFTGTVLVFSRTKHGAHKICESVNGMSVRASELHANRSLNQRKEALQGFKTGKYRVLVATDIAARGIDVKEIGLVVNFDLPDSSEDYVHRIGRTGRAGHEGRAISFATPDQAQDVRDIERLIRTTLPVKDHASVPKGKFSIRGGSGPSKKPFRSGGNGRSFGGNKRPGSFGSRPAPYTGGTSSTHRSPAAPARTAFAPKSTAPSAPRESFPKPAGAGARGPAPRGKRPFGNKPKGKARGFRKYEPAERFDQDQDGPSNGQYAFRTTL
jgi:ATP-dependent RNA helicase RhlE